MDQEKIGQTIKEIRKKHNLTQAEFAKKYNVTYQAVSKWETGKNIPDIALLTQICNDFEIDIAPILGTHPKKTKSKHLFILVLLISLAIIAIVIAIIYFHSHDDNFEFKTLSSNCSNFTISGSLAYNRERSSIYISHIDYCGGDDTKKYTKINCTLYETYDDTETKLGDHNYTGDEAITLEEFLANMTFNIQDYATTCEKYTEDSLHLEIDATDVDGNMTSYKVPLNLDDNCVTAIN